MTTTTNYLHGWMVLLFVLALAFSAKSQTLTFTSSDININSNGFVDDDGCPDFKTAQCNFIGATLQAGVYGNQFANDCGYRRVENQQFQCYTSVDANHFYALNGAGTNTISVDWLNFESVWHDIEMGVAYTATNNSIAGMDLVLDIAGVVPGTKVKLYYTYEIFAGAVGPSEVGEIEGAAVGPNLTLFNKNLIQQGGFNLNLNAGPNVGQIRRVNLSGFVNVIVGQPIPLAISTVQNVSIIDPGVDHKHIPNLDYWKDFATAEFGGNITLSLDPLPIPPTAAVVPAFSLFSVDIGSASELSDPGANGTEFFDPGDAYRFFAPPIPPGGIDGAVDDASFFPADVSPSAPDVNVPSLTGAPVASGLPLGAVQTAYFDMDGLDRLDFAVQPTGLPIPATPSTCIHRVKYLTVSVDDDRPENYLASPPFPGAPANSSSFSRGLEFGTTASNNEIFERGYFLTPFLPKLTYGVASEELIHPNLAPNPIIGVPFEDDDLDALDLASVASPCSFVYFSVDHEATGVDLSGLPLDPGTIYRRVTGGAAPVVVPTDLGLAPGTDINAFEFAVIADPASPVGPGTLALLFSTDFDDLTTPDDESGGLEPDLVYQSFMNGTYSVLDSLHFEDNIDAISLSNQSLYNITNATTCNPYNFIDPVDGLTATVSAVAVTLEWDPYPFSKVCQISGNKVSNSNDVSILVPSSPGNTPPSSKVISLTQLQPSTDYRIKVRCGCQFQGIQEASPFTAYVNFTTPGPLPPPGYIGSDIFSDSNSILVFPNPGRDIVNLTLNGFSDNAIVRLLDVSGRAVSEFNMGKSASMGTIQINVSDFSPGVYILEVSDGNKIQSERLIVQ